MRQCLAHSSPNFEYRGNTVSNTAYIGIGSERIRERPSQRKERIDFQAKLNESRESGRTIRRVASRKYLRNVDKFMTHLSRRDVLSKIGF